MNRDNVEKQFACGKVLQVFSNYSVVVAVMRLFYMVFAAWALWQTWREVLLAEKMISYIVIVFCLWRIHRQADPVVFVCMKGIVIRRKAADLFERLDMFWDAENYYIFLPYNQIIGFTAGWEEIHIGIPDDGGILIVPVDLQFLRYHDKEELLKIIENHGESQSDG